VPKVQGMTLACIRVNVIAIRCEAQVFQILVSGLILLYLVELALVATLNPIYVPSFLLGAFLVPAAFVAYL
jgi:hypothetical protein